MEIDPSKSLNQAMPGNGNQKQNKVADESAFSAALDKARAQTGGGAGASKAPGGAGTSPAELVGMLRHQAVQSEGRVQQAMDLVSSLSADFAHGRSPEVSELRGADEALARLEGQSMGEEKEWLRGLRSAVNFYLGRMEREQGGT
ncbi:hypothetical protein [Thiohalorhabdus methylotrophus]|uniref:DUF5610 domain-containing protein n=1 Tax=Thiohalorhabdus methylotrophus TaxID=3242694 RepID=A0ABV4TY69_9GAMM